MTITTSTRPPDRAAAPIGGSRTTVRVELDSRGRVGVHTRTSGEDGRPRLRPMLLSSTATTARVCLVPEGALLLAGDEVEIRVEVGPGATLELVEPGGTVAYDMRGGVARWDVDVALGQDARLIWGGEPFVLAAGADVRRHTHVQLGAGARLALRETLVLGRHAETGGQMTQRLEVTDSDGAPIVIEDLSIDGCPARGMIGHHRVIASVLGLRLDLPDRLLSECRYDLESGDTWWRRLGDEVHRTIPWEAWTAAVAACRLSGERASDEVKSPPDRKERSR